MDSGVNLVPYAASTNIGWDKRRPFGFLYGAKARRCNATTNSPDRLQCFPREVVRKFVISPGDFHDSSTRLSATIERINNDARTTLITGFDNFDSGIDTRLT